MLMPTVARCMTRQPWTIGPEATLAAAHGMMREHQIRHLPVVEDGKLVGIVTERDLHLMETLADADPDDIKVYEAMTESVYVVSPNDDLAEVVDRMADAKYGSAVVVHHQAIEGIFTAVDALKVLAEILRRVAD